MCTIRFRYSNGGRPFFKPKLKPHSDAYKRKYFIFSDEFVVTRGKHWRDNLTGAGLRNGETGQVWKGIDPAKIGRAALDEKAF